MSEPYTLKEAAAKLAVSTKTLMKHVEAGSLAYITIGTRTRQFYRFTLDDLEAFIREREV